MLKNLGSRFILSLFLFAFAASLIAPTLPAQQPQMVRLGSRRVSSGVDHDTITAGQQVGTFRAIQLRVRGGAVNFLRVIVQYGNGTRSEIQVRVNIPAGGTTRIIDLPGERRIIQRVDFWYTRANWATLPEVTLYGVR